MSSTALGIFALVSVSFAISILVTRFMIGFAPRIGFVDKPGGRKIHDNPKPLGGGVAITLGLILPLLAGVAAVRFAPQWTIEKLADHPDAVALVTGAEHQTPLSLALIGGILIMHAMGLVDDRKALGPYVKLITQLVVAGLLVICFDMRAMTFLDVHVGGPWLSGLLTVLWIAAITNAFNFLDNMDGLSAGVATICATAFLISTCLIGQWFVAATLACLVGSALGFLIWNFPPARIFMGDSGSLVLGFVLGVLTVRTTFITPGVDFANAWHGVFSPLLVLALPLYDLIVVSAIRMSRGKSPFVGDRNHFSHRLVNRGMSRRTAVLCLYLVTAATSVSAIVLPQVRSGFLAFLIVAQTVMILGLVMLLEQHPLPNDSSNR
jgi:UDP-GlcNAc:undecaprenyl-phosphate GlcNAc-1-phosphate transferase